MLRSPGRSALLALALVATPLSACTTRSKSGPVPTTVERTPVPPPEGHLGDLVIRSPSATWSKVRDLLGGSALLPRSFGALMTTTLGLPPTVGGEIDEAVPVLGAAATRGSTVDFVAGLHVRSGERFIAQLTRGPGAQFTAAVDPTTDITQLTFKSDAGASAGPVALAVSGDYLLVARTAEAVRAIGPYVARTLRNVPNSGDEIAIDFPEAALTGPAGEAARGVQAQLAELAGPLSPLLGSLDTAVGLLGDSSRARLTMTLDPSAAHARVVLTPKSGSGPGAKLVTELSVGGAQPLLDLPDTVSLGVLWRDSAARRGEDAPKQAQAVARLFGQGIGQAEVASITSALVLEAAARSDHQTMGVEFNGTGPTAVVRAPVSDPDKMRKALKEISLLAGLPTIKAALRDFHLKVSVEKAVVENFGAEVSRVRLSRDPAEVAPLDTRSARKRTVYAQGPGEAPNAIDLLYFVDDRGLFASAGYNPKDNLRALVAVPEGHSLASNPALASAIAAVGDEAAFVLFMDGLLVVSMMRGEPSDARTPSALVVAAGRSSSRAELWARFDVPNAVMRKVASELAQRRSPFGSSVAPTVP